MIRTAAIVLGCFAPFTVFAQDKLPDAPIPAREAAARMTVPDGFKVTLFAGEPDVVQPIAFTFDDRGRLWVVECMSYPKWNKDVAVEKTPDGRVLDKRQGKDRVVIFEDTDGDGQFDKRTVFADNLTNLSGIEYGFGGIWLCSIPNLLYIPIKPGEDKPAGPPEIKLDGWSLQSGHNAFNSPKWGPDGWLYGCNGILATSQVGLPGTPEKERTPMNCGVWRYHPTKKKFEVVAHGTTNPWGLDWDEYGELFITNCVIDHVWHVVPGGHYERMYGQDFNPHLYKLMPSIADHKHWAGGSWTESRGGKGAHSDAGGGHAHVGCMIYQGDNWPARYRNTLFTLNLHGNRINNDILARRTKALEEWRTGIYVAKHGKDFLLANDPWFRGIALDYGPDGSVFVSDWCDTGECHNYQVAHTSTGRLYNVRYGGIKPWHGDLAKLNDLELVELQKHRNEWFVRHARRLLMERSVRGDLTSAARKTLQDWSLPKHDAWTRLRAFWCRWATEPVPMVELRRIDNGDENIGAWTLRYAADELPTVEVVELLRRWSDHRGPAVRLHALAALQRLDVEARYNVIGSWLDLGSDLTEYPPLERDPYFSAMAWYAVEGMLTPESKRDFQFAVCRIPLVRELTARRIAEFGERTESFERLLPVFTSRTDPDIHRDVLTGMLTAFRGRRDLAMPRSWQDEIYPTLLRSPREDVRSMAVSLAVIFGDEKAVASLRALAKHSKAPLKQRQHALQLLVDRNPVASIALLHELLDDEAIRSTAIQGLAAYADPKTPSRILQRYAKFTADEKADAVHTLASRPAYALALLDAVADKTVARSDLNAFTVRQLLALNDKQVTKRVNEVWGTLRPASQEKAALMTKYKKLLTVDTLRQANLANGRLVYQKNCATCHKLFGEGGNIGPELTGSQRANLDYVLENMLDPSAVVPREYQVSIITTNNGRTLTGIVKEETERAVTVQTQNEIVIVPKDEIDVRRQSNLSMMPEGMLDRLTIEEIRDLVAYLASK